MALLMKGSVRVGSPPKIFTSLVVNAHETKCEVTIFITLQAEPLCEPQ